MLALRTSFGQGRYVSGEWDSVWEAVSFPGQPPLVWCHGNNQNATSDFTGYNSVLRLLAQNYTVVAADLGGNTFGNLTGIERVEQAVAYLGSMGSSGPVTMVGASMGGAVALNYARVHPENVQALVGIIPALSLDAPAGNPAEDEIDLAYPPSYDNANPTHAAHSPVNFASDLPSALPIHLWTSSNDPVCLPTFTQEFLTERPQTGHTDLGAQGHSGIILAAPMVAEWLEGL